jgi:SAM-dependent methyltransferase
MKVASAGSRPSGQSGGPLDDYPALHRYAGEQAAKYDARRFRHLRGRATDALEWWCLRRGLNTLERFEGPLHSLLDVPIGTGRMARRLKARGYELTGLDASESMLAVARGRAAAHVYEVGRAEHLPFADGSFDAVVCVRLFGHLPPGAKVEVLAEFSRVARRGAVVLVAAETGFLRVRRAWQARRGRPLRVWNPVTATEMQALADRAGFEILCTMRLFGPVSETRAVVLVPK